MAVTDFKERFNDMPLGDIMRQSPGAAAGEQFVRFGNVFVNLFELLHRLGERLVP